MENEELRYSKQLILDGFGKSTQNKLKASSVLVIGAGGLGSPALMYLVGAGVGHIGIVDFDTVTLSNLNRQILFTFEDIGKKKVDCAFNQLTRINPNVVIKTYDTRITLENIQEIISPYDVVIDATDNFASRYLISDCCFFMKKPLIEGAATAYDGMLMTIIPGETPCYRCLYPMPPSDGYLPNCSDVGIVGALTGIVGSTQALEAIKLLGNFGQVLKGKILTIDAFSSTFREISWKNRDHCPLCGKNPTITELSEYDIKCRTKIFNL